MDMGFFATGKDFLIALICVLVAFRLLNLACQLPGLLIALVIMPVFLFLTNEVSVFVIAAGFHTVLMLIHPAYEGGCYTVAALVMVVSAALRYVTNQLLGIAGIIMLVCLNAAVGFLFHRDGGKDQRIGRYKNDYGCNS